MTAEQFTVTYFRCPHCRQGQFNAEHLPSGAQFGPWYCDACGGSFTGLRGRRGIELELRAERKIVTSNVLVLPPQAQPVYFIVPGMRFEGPAIDTSETHRHESAQFFYESHSCPTNWFRPEMVYHDGDSDPHGLLQFVRAVDSATLPPDQDFGPNDHDFALIALIEASKQERAPQRR